MVFARIIFLAFTLMLLIGNKTVAQFPDGVYYTIEQLRNKQPAFNASLQMKPYRMRYLMRSDIDSIDRKFIRENILAYVKNDSVYIRAKGRKLKEELVFSLSITKGNFITYYSPYTYEESPRDVGEGILFIGLGPSALVATKTQSPYFVLSLRSGNSKGLNNSYIENRLKEILPEELINFQNEPSRTLAVFVKYIDLLNKELEKKQ